MFLLFLAALCLVAYFVIKALYDPKDRTVIVLRRSTMGGFIGFLILGIVTSGYRQVPAGHRGVLLRMGAVSGVLSEGPHVVVPFVSKVDLVEVRTQKTEAKAAAASKDLQNVHTDVAVNFHVSDKSVDKLYQNVGLDFDNRIIHPAVQETVKAVVARYTAEELIRLREQVKNEVDTSLTKRLLAYNIVVEPAGVSLTNFGFSDEFNKAIEQKQIAQQTAEQQKYVLQKAKLEAETAITTAKGEAEANRIKAQALQSQGGSRVLAREWITKWKGDVPAVVSSSNGSVMLNLESLLKDSGKTAN